jgi:small ligand-binding sensory domain FIST
MNFIGKIFVLIIFILSVVFSAATVMVFVTHKNWKVKAVALAGDLSAAKVANENMVRTKNELENDLAKGRAANRYQIAELTSKLNAEVNKTQVLTAQNADLNTQLAETQNQNQLIVQHNTFLASDNKMLRSGMIAAEETLRAVERRLYEANDSLDAEQNNRELLAGQIKDLASMATSQSMVMKMHGLDIYSLSTEPPPLDGVITAVSTTSPLVQISLGSDDGLKKGHALEVFRGSSYLGRIVIREVDPSRAVGYIVADLQRDNFQKGDRVATKL